MLNYKAIEIFTSEEARYRRKPVVDAVLQFVRELKIAARCIVTRGIAGCYESGELASGRLEILSFNMPLRIYIVLPSDETERALDGLNELVEDGIIALHDLNVLSHRTRNSFFPRQLMVRDVMTRNPKKVAADTSLNEAARLLLSSIFTGLPVVDKNNRPVGVITQGDLIRKGGFPLRLGLLAESDQERRNAMLTQLTSLRADEVMTSPPIMIAAEQPLTEAVALMLEKEVKRVPVVDENGYLTGMLSRSDIFRTVMRESPDWKTFRAQKIEVAHLKHVSDILRRDTLSVSPQTSLEEVIRVIDSNDIQRMAVVDAQGKLLGLISDRDLLCYFKEEESGIWGLLAKMKDSSGPAACKGDLRKCLAETNAGTVMTTDLTTVREEMQIEEAIALMIEKRLKRLPVVDAEGRFKGMISRDSLLRTGFGRSD
jgi:CBS-domain-containing membrane protein